MTDRGWPGDFLYCPHCRGSLVERQMGHRLRPLCDECGWVHFRNPGVGVAVLLRDGQERVLLVQRGPEVSQSGKWCIPCGYLDYGEAAQAGARREVLEETGLIVEVGSPIFVRTNFHDPAKITVGVWFEGSIVGGKLEAGDDAVAAGWFGLDRLPELAFETDIELLDSLAGSGLG